jgi:hypothetical protein
MDKFAFESIRSNDSDVMDQSHLNIVQIKFILKLIRVNLANLVTRAFNWNSNYG